MNLEKSWELANEIVVNQADCFQNALRGLVRRERAVFVVGFVRDSAGNEKPTEHAWLELDGEILDPTAAVHWQETVAQTIYQPLLRVPRSEAQEKYKIWLSPNTWGVRWYEIVPQEVWDRCRQEAQPG